MRNILAALFFIAYIQRGFGTDGIQIEIVNFKGEETSFNIEVMVTNNSAESYWYHYSALKSSAREDENILYFDPNFSFYGITYNSQLKNFFVQVMEIPPNETIRKIFTFERSNYEVEVDFPSGTITRGRKKLPFSEVKYVNMTFVFFCYELPEILDPIEYYHTIYNDGIVISKLFKNMPLPTSQNLNQSYNNRTFDGKEKMKDIEYINIKKIIIIIFLVTVGGFITYCIIKKGKRRITDTNFEERRKMQ